MTAAVLSLMPVRINQLMNPPLCCNCNLPTERSFAKHLGGDAAVSKVPKTPLNLFKVALINILY